MARGNFKDYLKGAEVWVKKYFYVLRPLLAVRWIEANLGAVPMEFEVLVDRLITSKVLKQEIKELLRLKRSGAELDRGPRIDALSDFVESELKRLDSKPIEYQKPDPSVENLNKLFRKSLHQLWE